MQGPPLAGLVSGLERLERVRQLLLQPYGGDRRLVVISKEDLQALHALAGEFGDQPSDYLDAAAQLLVRYQDALETGAHRLQEQHDKDLGRRKLKSSPLSFSMMPWVDPEWLQVVAPVLDNMQLTLSLGHHGWDVRYGETSPVRWERGDPFVLLVHWLAAIPVPGGHYACTRPGVVHNAVAWLTRRGWEPEDIAAEAERSGMTVDVSQVLHEILDQHDLPDPLGCLAGIRTPQTVPA